MFPICRPLLPATIGEQLDKAVSTEPAVVTHIRGHLVYPTTLLEEGG